MKIVVKKGLDLPLVGKPQGPLLPCNKPKQIALNLNSFDDLRFKVHAKVGDSVKIGQSLVESKSAPGLMFVSPAGGIVSDIRRGSKRRLLDIVIDVAEQEEFEERQIVDLDKADRKQIVQLFMQAGLFPHIRLRPFNLIPPPHIIPRAIFVSAFETRPFTPSCEMQVLGRESYFQIGLNALAKLTSGKVHLVYGQKSCCESFVNAKNVEKHEACGPHPAGTNSVHIHEIEPIRHPEDYVWATTALDVVVIGKMIAEGKYETGRVISLAGEGVLKGKAGFFQARMGFPVAELIDKCITERAVRIISGDPLTGAESSPTDFMGFSQTVLSVLLENTKREPFHFFRLGLNKFSATRAYASGHKTSPEEGYCFTTNQHGEERAFVDNAVYDKVMPMQIPTVPLIKAVLAQDFEVAQELGFLEVVPEDFALPAFICPSKVDMISIVKEGLHNFAKDMGH